MMMDTPKYAWIERRKIHHKAKVMLGLVKQDLGDYDDFMDECIDNLTADVETMDEDQARETCQLMWDEEGSY